MEKSEQVNELAAALALAQIEIDNPTKTSTNPFFKSKYADLAEVLSVVRPAFGKHGLSISQHPNVSNGIVTVDTLLMHSSGQWLVSSISAAAGKDIQTAGAAITYCRRYALSAIAGVSQEDGDGNNAKVSSQFESDDMAEDRKKNSRVCDPMEDCCLADFKDKVEEFGTVAELDAWKVGNWHDISKSLTGKNLVAFMKHFAGVRSGLSATGA